MERLALARYITPHPLLHLSAFAELPAPGRSRSLPVQVVDGFSFQ